MSSAGFWSFTPPPQCSLQCWGCFYILDLILWFSFKSCQTESYFLESGYLSGLAKNSPIAVVQFIWEKPKSQLKMSENLSTKRFDVLVCTCVWRGWGGICLYRWACPCSCEWTPETDIRMSSLLSSLSYWLINWLIDWLIHLLESGLLTQLGACPLG